MEIFQNPHLCLHFSHERVLSGSKHVGLQATRHQQCLGAVGVETQRLEGTKQAANNLNCGGGGGSKRQWEGFGGGGAQQEFGACTCVTIKVCRL